MFIYNENKCNSNQYKQYKQHSFDQNAKFVNLIKTNLKNLS